MIWFLYRMFVGCHHKWAMKDSGIIRRAHDNLSVGRWKDCQCEHCGTWKRFNLTVE